MYVQRPHRIDPSLTIIINKQILKAYKQIAVLLITTKSRYDWHYLILHKQVAQFETKIKTRGKNENRSFVLLDNTK